MRTTSRRDFLKTTAAGSALLGLSELGFLSQLPRVSADETKSDPKTVQLRPEIEPLVRLMENSARDKVLEEVAGRIKQGTTYKDVLAALQLAGVRNVQPKPSVGFKFHAVLVVNSAHVASMASPDEHRWLPIFWAIDEFKDSQARDVKEGNWTMSPVDESKVPPADKARQAFLDAMENWDEEAADAAVAGLARTAKPDEIYEMFYRLGSRDFRAIGHKAIYVANSQRTLEHIGWQHAEPILRSLAYALLNHQGEANPAKSDLTPDKPIRRNRELAAKINEGWKEGKPEDSATREFLATLRTGSDEECCRQVVELLNRGVAPQSIWDGLFVGAGELLMRQPGIVALHAVTSTNALHYAFTATKDDTTKRLLLLQNAAFVPLFRGAMTGRGTVKEGRLDELEPVALQSQGKEAVSEIMRDVSGNPMAAAQKMLTYLKDHPEPKELIDTARLLIFLKGSNSHDYKFSTAALEDYYHVSPAWRNRFLASSVFNLCGSGKSDNSLVQRTRVALGYVCPFAPTGLARLAPVERRLES